MKVAVLMATYNGEKYIKEQINSILNQSFDNFDLLIRDDGSKDRTKSIILKMAQKDSRVKLIGSDSKNVGQLKNFEFLMKYIDAKYTYVFFSDQDDIWFPQKIELTLKGFKNNYSKFQLVYTNYEVRDFNKNDHGRIRYDGKIPDRISFERLLFQNWIMGCTMAINFSLNEVAKNIPSSAENHDNWISNVAAMLGDIEYISTPTMIHRIHENNVTQNENTKKISNQIIRTIKRFHLRDSYRSDKIEFIIRLSQTGNASFDRINVVNTFKKMLLHPTIFNFVKMFQYKYLGVNFKQTLILGFVFLV